LLVAKSETVRFQAAWLGKQDLLCVIDTLAEGGRLTRRWTTPGASSESRPVHREHARGGAPGGHPPTRPYPSTGLRGLFSRLLAGGS
jgi:hypothetical protein